MPVAATKTKTNPITPAESLRRVSKQLTAQASADWRTWAIAIANGESAPDGRDLLAAAAALGIDDPAVAIQADADAILEARVAARNAAACKQTAVEMLAPFGGDPDKVLQAIEAAKAEVERLNGIYLNACDDCGAAYYRATVHRCRIKHPRVWLNYNDTGMGVDL